MCSTGLGIGVNLSDVCQVTQYGPPRQVNDFVQEMGRPGPDGKPGKSLLFFTGHHLRRYEEKMELYTNSNDCLCKVLLTKFGATASSTNVTHDCCVICHAACKCLGDSYEVELSVYVWVHSPATNLQGY